MFLERRGKCLYIGLWQKWKAFSVLSVNLEKFVNDFISSHSVDCIGKFVHLSLEQTTCFNNFNLEKFVAHKATDIQRVRESFFF